MVLQTLSVVDSLQLLKKAGIPTVPSILVSDFSQLKKAVHKTGFPCVLKAVSAKAVHKTEKKAVRLHIQSIEQAKTAFRELSHIQGFEGVLVQPQLEGTELFIGSKKDIQFGSTLVFGIGGVLVELLKDVSVRVAPVSRHDAVSMVREISHQNVLRGFRGKPAVDSQKLVSVLLKTSQFVEKTRPLELDINPLIATKNRLVAVDARIVVEK